MCKSEHPRGQARTCDDKRNEQGVGEKESGIVYPSACISYMLLSPQASKRDQLFNWST